MVATISAVNYLGDGTQSGFLSALSTQMQALGYTEFASFSVSGNQSRVWFYNMNPAAAKGSIYIQALFISATNLRVFGFSSFNASNNTGSDEAAYGSSVSLNLSASFVFQMCSGSSEVRGLVLQENTANRFFLGYIRPANKQAGWDENLYTFAFFPSTFISFSFFSSLRTATSLVPPGHSVAAFAFTGLPFGESFDPNDNNRGVIAVASISATSTSLRIPVGKFSDEVVAAPSNGMNLFVSRHEVSISERYTLFDGNTSNTQPRLSIRTT